MNNNIKIIFNNINSLTISVFKDINGIDHVLFSNEVNLNDLNHIEHFSNSVQFDSYENHIHILYRIPVFYWGEITKKCDDIGHFLLRRLLKEFPNKSFRVYISINIRQGMIIRFHEKRIDCSNWIEDEKRYSFNQLRIYDSDRIDNL